MNAITPNIFNPKSLDSVRKYLSSQAKRIHHLNCAIAELRSLQAPEAPSIDFSGADLSSAETTRTTQAARIKDLLATVAELRTPKASKRSAPEELPPSSKRRIAISNEDEICEIEPRCTSTKEFFGKAWDAIRRNDYPAAHRVYNQAIKTHPNDYRFYQEKADLFFDEENYAKAFDFCEEALRLAPNNEELNVLKDLIIAELEESENESVSGGSDE